jgi:hypothetical protein
VQSFHEFSRGVEDKRFCPDQNADEALSDLGYEFLANGKPDGSLDLAVVMTQHLALKDLAFKHDCRNHLVGLPAQCTSPNSSPFVNRLRECDQSDFAISWATGRNDFFHKCPLASNWFYLVILKLFQ